jgi:hypothetical protein
MQFRWTSTVAQRGSFRIGFREPIRARAIFSRQARCFHDKIGENTRVLRSNWPERDGKLQQEEPRETFQLGNLHSAHRYFSIPALRAVVCHSRSRQGTCITQTYGEMK